MRARRAVMSNKITNYARVTSIFQFLINVLIIVFIDFWFAVFHFIGMALLYLYISRVSTTAFPGNYWRRTDLADYVKTIIQQSNTWFFFQEFRNFRWYTCSKLPALHLKTLECLNRDLSFLGIQKQSATSQLHSWTKLTRITWKGSSTITLRTSTNLTKTPKGGCSVVNNKHSKYSVLLSNKTENNNEQQFLDSGRVEHLKKKRYYRDVQLIEIKATQLKQKQF